MAAELTVEIVTPYRKVLSQACNEVVLPSAQGEISVLPGHAALLSQLGIGVIRVRLGQQKQAIAVRNGFIQVDQNRVTILADDALTTLEINREGLKSARTELEKKLVDVSVSIDEREVLFSERSWLDAQTSAL